MDNKGNNNSIIIEEKDYVWRKEQEDILKKWADKALCFKMMHERSLKKYWCLNAWFNIPVIIISTITGTGNFASGSFGPNSEFIIFILGAFNIFAGILATIATYTGVAQKLESHRFACISWDKFARKLQIELSKIRNDRVKAKDFIKQCAEDYDRLIEISPIIPNDIIRWFTNMIATGEFDENLDAMSKCLFDLVCFPCGCNICNCITCCCKQPETKIDTSIKQAWLEIELPEVIGRIKPTEIAPEPMLDLPPPLLIMDSNRSNNESIKNDISINIETKNIYDIYNLDAVGDNNI